MERRPNNEPAAESYCQRATLELAGLLTHQRRPRGKQRRDSALLRSIVREVMSAAEAVEQALNGPWEVGTRPLKKPGRGGLKFIPLVQRGQTVIMVSTAREAEELAAFLNYCGMDEFSDP